MLGTIMLPHDGSDSASLAFQYADLLPSQSVRLVRVEPPFQVLEPGPLENFRPDWRDVRTEQIHQELAPFAEHFRRQGRGAEIVVRFGDPAAELIAASEGADLVIMTTQGRGTAGRALFGSVADRVSRHAHTPTLLIRAGAAQLPAPRIARIVVPLDGSSLAEEALPLAATLAGNIGVPVHVLRVVDPYQVAAELPEDRQQQGATAQQMAERRVPTATAYLAGIAEPLQAQGLAVKADVLVGATVFTLLDEIRPDDLVVMTTHGRGGLERWLLGSVAEQLVRAAAGPTLLVHAGPTPSSPSAVADEREPA